MPEHVRADDPKPSPLAAEAERRFDCRLGEGLAIRVAEHQLGPQVPMRLERGFEPRRSLSTSRCESCHAYVAMAFSTSIQSEPPADPATRSALEACLLGSLGLGELSALPIRHGPTDDGRDSLPAPPRSQRRGGHSRGFDVHAGVIVSASDRDGRERLLRNCARRRYELEHLLTRAGFANLTFHKGVHEAPVARRRGHHCRCTGLIARRHRVSDRPPNVSTLSCESRAEREFRRLQRFVGRRLRGVQHRRACSTPCRTWRAVRVQPCGRIQGPCNRRSQASAGAGIEPEQPRPLRDLAPPSRDG